MAFDLEEFQQLKKDAEKDGREADRLKGSLDQLMESIKQRFGCETLEEVDEELDNIQKELDKLEPQYEKELAKYQREVDLASKD